jgi:wobble nucleotide-excising tRNase
MNIQNENIKIQYLIIRETEAGRFQDAIYFTPEEFEKLNEKDLEKLENERVNNFLQAIEEQKNYVPPELTVEELELEKTNKEKELQDIQGRLEDITASKEE